MRQSQSRQSARVHKTNNKIKYNTGQDRQIKRQELEPKHF